MKIQRRAAVIGLGNWGSSLAAALDAAGLLTARVHARRRGSLTKLNARVLWLCVPDAAIVGTAEWLVAERGDLHGQVVVHSSGALDREVLAVAERAGARTASVHPMMSFPTRRVVALRGTRFGVEAGDPATRKELFALVQRLGGRPFTVDGKGKAMYHAGAMFGSPLLVATLAAGVRAMHEAGISEREALALLGPMAAATVANVQKRGLARSFSGPLARGDAATVKLHREALAGHPLVAHVYDGLARLAAEDLPSGSGRNRDGAGHRFRRESEEALGDAVEPECYPSSIMPGSSRLFLDYTESAEPLAPFYSTAAAGKGWISEGRRLSAAHRARLADLLAAQNAAFGAGSVTAANIERLRNEASAVVTGQQVTLFGGPLYTLLKAATAIARAREATEAGFDTVPIFWLASEDHDFAEIAYVDLPAHDGLKTVAIGPAPEAPVPVGGILLGSDIETALAELESILGSNAITASLRQVYRPGSTLSEAFGSFMARLFAPWGLIVIDPAGRDFHALGAEVLGHAVREADALHAALVERDNLLAARGYHAQVKVTEQSSLLFLIDEKTGTRLSLRQVRADGGLQWKAGGKHYTDAELLHILQVTPERCSPNALLRPVFQDAVLPTSAYIAGPAEIAYFAQSEVLYRAILGRPTAVLLRLSATLVEAKIAAGMERHEVQLPDALTTADALAQRLAARAMPVEGKQKLAAAGNSLDSELTAVTEWMAQMDAGLGRSANTAASKMRYQMNRLRRLAARYQLEKETSLARHAQAITQALYPGGHLQERVVAGVYFLATQGDGLLETLVDAAKDACPGHKLLPL